MVMPKVYVASKAKYGHNWRVLRQSWKDYGEAEIISTWIDESGEGETSDYSDLWLRCIEEASSADLLIAYHWGDDVWKGAFIEIGAALASEVPIFVVGKPPGTWMQHPLVHRVRNHLDALQRFKEMRK